MDEERAHPLEAARRPGRDSRSLRKHALNFSPYELEVAKLRLERPAYCARGGAFLSSYKAMTRACDEGGSYRANGHRGGPCWVWESGEKNKRAIPPEWPNWQKKSEQMISRRSLLATCFLPKNDGNAQKRTADGTTTGNGEKMQGIGDGPQSPARPPVIAGRENPRLALGI